MQKYELMFAVRGTLIESEVKKEKEGLISELKKHGAEIVYDEDWGKVNLGYKIKHETEAYYTVLVFTYEGKNLTELEKFIQLQPNVIRALVTKINQEDYEPFTKEAYDAGLEEYYNQKQERRKDSMPKTRATTTRQLEEDMQKIKGSKTSSPKVVKTAPVTKVEKEEKPQVTPDPITKAEPKKEEVVKVEPEKEVPKKDLAEDASQKIQAALDEDLTIL